MTGIPTTVTRIDVVDQNGVHEFWADRWDIHIQDGGQTVKFIQKDGYGAPAKARRDVALACEIAKEAREMGKRLRSGKPKSFRRAMGEDQ
jgi:hypothetical protein